MMMKFIIHSLVMLHFTIIISSFDNNNNNNITLGSILYTSTTKSWSSSNNKFTLNFIPSSNSSSFILSINHISAISVWQAGGPYHHYTVDSGGHFCLHPSGDLQLVNSSKFTIWSSNTSGFGVTHAVLEDSGNFVLKNGSVSVWSSFEHPTDTLVPSQNLTVDTFLRNGIYTLNVTRFGDVVLNWNYTVEYWKLGSNHSNNKIFISPYLTISALGVLTISDETLSTPMNLIFSADYGEGGDDIFRFLKLESDGNSRIYTYDKNGVIRQQWTALSDQCLVFGYCGHMSICSYNSSGPSCRCPSNNFIPVNPNDPRQGCTRKSKLENCSNGVNMVQLEHTKFLTFGHGLSSQIFFTASSACRLNCLDNPACVASSSLSDGSVHCYLKNPGFLSGYNSPAFPGTSYIKVCGAVVPNPNSIFSDNARISGGSRVPTWVLGVAVLSAFSGLLLLECAAFCCWKKFRGNNAFNTKSSTPDALLQYASGAPVQFSYEELQKSTNEFSEKLGEGGVGKTVYKGTFGNKFIAVKKMDEAEHTGKQFRAMVATISTTHHINLVKMIGFCSERRRMLVVYEFLKNGSMADVLFNSEATGVMSLNWDFRFRTAVGAARGLSYLHESCRECVVHCDFKLENILLDENFNAKVSDFGLVATELVKESVMTPEADVYNFGIVLLEMVTGRRSTEVIYSYNSLRQLRNIKLWEWVYEEYENGNIEGIIDKRVERNGVKMEEVMRVIEVGFWCIQEDVLFRPTMGKVVQMLEGVVEILKPVLVRKEGLSLEVKAGHDAPSSSFSFPIVENI